MTIKSIYPQVLPVGETAFTVEFGNAVDNLLNTQVHALDKYLNTHSISGIVETVPTYRSLLVIYDPCCSNPLRLQNTLQNYALEVVNTTISTGETHVGQIIEIPVHYGGEWGPDLPDVAEHTHLSIPDVIRKHTQATYQVAMLGFAPGFTYLLGLPAELNTPRLKTPRIHIPPGSVGIAGDQTGLYAIDTPGGWRIIGRAIEKLFDPTRPSPFLLHAGDRVRFTNAD